MPFAYFNFIQIWKIENLKADESKALRLVKAISIKELVLKFFNKESQKNFLFRRL